MKDLSQILFTSLLAGLLLAACGRSGPTPVRSSLEKSLDGAIGQPTADFIQWFGAPSRTESLAGGKQQLFYRLRTDATVGIRSPDRQHVGLSQSVNELDEYNSDDIVDERIEGEHRGHLAAGDTLASQESLVIVTINSKDRVESWRTESVKRETATDRLIEGK